MQTVFPCYSDPGHGWAKVPRLLLKELEIEQQVSAYSYQKGDFVYLEEDADMSLFFNAMQTRGITPTFKGKSSNKTSRIRGYASFKPT